MRASRYIWPLAIVVTGFAVAQYPGAAGPPAAYKKGFDAITVADAKAYLGYLAGPECMGRGTGQPGFQKAAEYVAARFKEFGLKPVGDNGTYFQGVPFWRSGFVEAGSEIRIGSGKSLPASGNFRLTGGTVDVDLSGNVVELRPNGDELGASADDLAKRIVFVYAERLTPRARQALNRAQPALVLVVRPEVGPPEYTVRRSAPTGNTPARAPMGTISEKAATEVASSLTFQERSGGTSGPSEAAVRISNETIRVIGKFEAGDIKVPNVVGLLEGSDPALKHEVVGLGSHLDHLGVSNGQIYYGADDDASGSTALIQVAKAFAQNGQKPRRSILFMAFCGEEMGLVGSGFYADNPLFPHANMIAELQMDMVGRNSVGPQNGDRNRIDVEAENVDTIRLVGSKRISTDLHNTILELNKHVGFKFKYDAEDVYTRSDHYQFAKNGIPVAFLFSGFHPDYHQPTDTPEKINYDKIANTAKLFYLTAATLADRTERPRKDVAGGLR